MRRSSIIKSNASTIEAAAELFQPVGGHIKADDATSSDTTARDGGGGNSAAAGAGAADAAGAGAAAAGVTSVNFTIKAIHMNSITRAAQYSV